ncbi:unnamed protein product, partial [Ectocarpus sp. 12 AP-2014]
QQIALLSRFREVCIASTLETLHLPVPPRAGGIKRRESSVCVGAHTSSSFSSGANCRDQQQLISCIHHAHHGTSTEGLQDLS